MDNITAFFCIIVIAGVCFLVGASTGVGYGVDRMKTEATSVGVASYIVNPKTGETKFQWATNTNAILPNKE